MNIKRYILPASIAAAIHAVFVLAFPEGPAPSTIVALCDLSTPEPAKPPEPVPVTLEPETMADVPMPQAPKGEQPPDIPDSLITSNPSAITVDVRPAIFHPEHVTRLGPIGQVDGIENAGPNLPAPTLFRPGDLDRIPRATTQIPPDYPGSLRQSGIGGEVLIEFTVDSTGRVMTAQVLKSTRREFEEPTLRAVRKWRFEPGRRGGLVVPFRMSLPVDFSVGGI